MQIIIDYLCHAVNTLFGFYQQPFLKEWDEMLNDIIDKGLIVEIDDLTIKFNYEGKEYVIWVGNRWYAYGHIYSIGDKYIKRDQEFRPRFRTMRRLRDLHIGILEDQKERELFKIYGDKSWS
ncbi:hypothetical protein I6N29_00390 [Escherichia coli]|uniref:hypothetical protein n=1 Tax=Escherichia coli TaxID=562 RepID=UPI001EDFD2F4|nr:hypothetical protein [Escherichia coli]MCG3955082.1 hypothetical protein [Escherichia coli]MCG3955162.1 hypothetical protein [Escherichia coli]MCG3959300.1 hypothetical protein [Escherichia coli]MDN3531187.1 hypothetical protein [Escherichia coli]WHF61697.1 hypothetical protein OMD12_12825 [Escherichia coli]